MLTISACAGVLHVGLFLARTIHRCRVPVLCECPGEDEYRHHLFTIPQISLP